MNKSLLALAAALWLSACSQGETQTAASAVSSAASAPKPVAAAASATSAASDSWVTDNGEKTNAIPQSTSASQASAPVAAASSAAPKMSAPAAKPTDTKLTAACEKLVDRMSRCYDRLPAESAGEMKATLAEVRTSLAGTDENTCKNMSEEFNGTAAALGCE